MDAEFALKFVEEWEAGWNSHDVDRILRHYADDVVFKSPYISHRYQEPTGEVRGKEQLRSYRSTAPAPTAPERSRRRRGFQRR